MRFVLVAQALVPAPEVGMVAQARTSLAEPAACVGTALQGGLAPPGPRCEGKVLQGGLRALLAVAALSAPGALAAAPAPDLVVVMLGVTGWAAHRLRARMATVPAVRLRLGACGRHLPCREHTGMQVSHREQDLVDGDSTCERPCLAHSPEVCTVA